MTAKRKQLRPTDRFEIFKRDGFRCQYCGSSPGTTVLVVDHIRPVSDGGTNEAINLVTSCEECNRGKAARKLCAVPESISDRIDREKELALQQEEYDKLRRRIIRREKGYLSEVAEDWYRCYGTRLDGKELASVAMFIKRLGVSEVLASVAACVRCATDAGRFRYLCGVCWGKIKANDERKNAKATEVPQ